MDGVAERMQVEVKGGGGGPAVLFSVCTKHGAMDVDEHVTRPLRSCSALRFYSK